MESAKPQAAVNPDLADESLRSILAPGEMTELRAFDEPAATVQEEPTTGPVTRTRLPIATGKVKR